jgi:hypothetical protein
VGVWTLAWKNAQFSASRASLYYLDLHEPYGFREANPFQQHSKLLAGEFGQTLRHAFVRTARSKERDQFARFASRRPQRDGVKRAVRQTRGLIEESLGVPGKGLTVTGTLVRQGDKNHPASDAAFQQGAQRLDGIREAGRVTDDLSNRRKDLFFVHNSHQPPQIGEDQPQFSDNSEGGLRCAS